MQIEAIYNQGILEFLTPIKFQHQKFKVIIEIRDDEIIDPSTLQKTEAVNYQLPDEARELAKAMELELDQIRNAPYTALKETHTLSQKQQERMRAFSLRNDVRDAY